MTESSEIMRLHTVTLCTSCLKEVSQFFRYCPLCRGVLLEFANMATSKELVVLQARQHLMKDKISANA